MKERALLFSFAAVIAGAALISRADAGAQTPPFRTGTQVVPPKERLPEAAPLAVKQTILDLEVITDDAGAVKTVRDLSAPYFAAGAAYAAVHFWATWCPSCLHELKYFSAQNERALSDGRGLETYVIAVATENKKTEQIRDYLNNKALAPALDVYTAPMGAVMKAYNVTALPATVFFDAEGTELKRVVGPYNWADPQAFHPDAPDAGDGVSQ